MKRIDFERLLDRCCQLLTDEARSAGFASSARFENRVREVLDGLILDSNIHIDYNPHPQAFPDIAIGEYGVEVKFTKQDTWRCIANSVLETQRIEGVKHIYIVFGKMGGAFQKCGGGNGKKALSMSGHRTYHALRWK